MANITTTEELQAKIAEMRKAQEIFASYSQEQVDILFHAAAMAANNQRIPLAKMAIEETGMGVLEDKILKNHYAAEFVYHKYRTMKTCGVIEENPAMGIRKVAAPLGVIGAMIPITNPTSTTIFKCLLCLKTRNAILISPHPGAKKCTCEAARVVAQAAYEAGAPAGIIEWLEEPTMELSGAVMKQVDCVLATGGPGVVQAAYSSGKPAIGVGPGNCPAIVDETASIQDAVCSILHSKTFDSGMMCPSEQSLIVVGDANYQGVKEELVRWEAHLLTAEEIAKVRPLLAGENGAMSSAIMGHKAEEIAWLAGFQVPPKTKLLVGEVTATDSSEPFAQEKLAPILALYRASTFGQALELADQLICAKGCGHTCALWMNPQQEEHLRLWYTKLKSCRLILNSPASQGGIGDLYNFGLAPSFTLGCGSWGGNSIAQNVGPQHLLNIKTVAERRENMLWLRLPQKVYFQKGCTPVALRELEEEYDCKRVFVITDHFLYQNGNVRPILTQLEQMGLQYASYYDITAEPTIEQVQKGLTAMAQFQPDGIIGFGGGSALDAAKLMWYAYEHPEVAFSDLMAPFLDVRKRIFRLPRSGKKAVFFAIATTAGTGAENTPFAVITDESTGLRWPVTDYELLPTVSIVDADHMMDLPKGLTRDAGISVLANGLEAHVSLFASDYTDGFALIACKNVFRYLPRAYDKLGQDVEARVKLADASALAGIAIGNAFPGLNQALAHQLSAWHHLTQGVACALVMLEVMDYNAQKAPEKMGTLSSYHYPQARERYAELAAYCGFGGKTEDECYQNLRQKVAELRDAIEIYPTIREYGIEESYFLNTLDAMTEAAWNDQFTGCNPVYPLMSDMRTLYLRSYYGGAEYEALEKAAAASGGHKGSMPHASVAAKK